jgi:hypothetical protein
VPAAGAVFGSLGRSMTTYPADVVVGLVAGAAFGQVAVALRRGSSLRRGRAR